MSLLQDTYTLGGKLTALDADHAEWSEAIFGREHGPMGALKHLEAEVREAQDAPTDISEYADCLLLLLDAKRRAGFTLLQLVEAAQVKMVANKMRQWPRCQPDEPCFHIKTSELGVIHANGGHPEHVQACAGTGLGPVDEDGRA